MIADSTFLLSINCAYVIPSASIRLYSSVLIVSLLLLCFSKRSSTYLKFSSISSSSSEADSSSSSIFSSSSSNSCCSCCSWEWLDFSDLTYLTSLVGYLSTYLSHTYLAYSWYCFSASWLYFYRLLSLPLLGLLLWLDPTAELALSKGWCFPLSLVPLSLVMAASVVFCNCFDELLALRRLLLFLPFFSSSCSISLAKFASWLPRLISLLYPSVGFFSNSNSPFSI